MEGAGVAVFIGDIAGEVFDVGLIGGVMVTEGEGEPAKVPLVGIFGVTVIAVV